MSEEVGMNHEDFIIVENPDFSNQQNPILINASQCSIATGVENDILPPPRTLDDAPLRRRKRRAESDAGKDKKRKYVKQPKKNYPESVEKASLNDAQINQNSLSEESERNIVSFLLQSHTPDNHSSSLNQDDSVVEIQRSTSYGLRKKFQSKDFSYDSDFLYYENEDDILVRPHICSDCHYRFSTKRELQHHQVSMHNHHDCDQCDSRFRTLLGLKRHVSVKHSQTEPAQAEIYSCSECNLSCSTQMELTQHQSSVHGRIKDCTCDLCGNDFTTLLGLQKHISLKHSETECTLCNQTFKLGQALLDHMKTCGRETKASEILGIKVRKPKIFPCKMCGKKFSEKSNRIRHMRLHKGILNFTCDHCGKKCSEKQSLLSHIRHIHTGERPYHCHMCPSSFVTKSDLNRHQMTVHTNRRCFSCSDCGKAFKTREALKSHLKHERGEKLWQCGVCSKKFVTKGSLKAHMVVHSGIKMYECETCQRQFTHKGSLEAHVRVHTGLMPYVCPKCGKKFAHLQNRNRHLRTMHDGTDTEECQD